MPSDGPATITTTEQSSSLEPEVEPALAPNDRGARLIRRFQSRPAEPLAIALAVLCVMSGSWLNGGLGKALTLVWIAAVAAGAIWVMSTRGRSRIVAVGLMPAVSVLGVLSVGALSSVILPFAAMQQPVVLRLALTGAILAASLVFRFSVPEASTAPNRLVALAAIAPLLLAPLIIFAGNFELLGSDPAPRLAAQLNSEDSAAWLSQSYLTFANGMPPRPSQQAEHSPATASAVGTVLEMARHGRQKYPGAAAIQAVNAVFTSWILAAFGLASASLAYLLLKLPGASAVATRQRALGVLLGSAVIQLCAFSLPIALLSVQQLSLAWLGTALALLTLTVGAATKVPRRHRILVAVTLGLLAVAVGNIWPFAIVTLGVFSGFVLYEIWRTGPGRRLLPMATFAIGIVVGGFIPLRVLAEYEVSAGGLLGAAGASLSISTDLLLLWGALGTAVAALVARVVSDALDRLLLGLAVSGACGALGGVLVQSLPIATSDYARNKLMFLAVMSLPLILAFILAWQARLPQGIPTVAAIVIVGLTLISQTVLSTGLVWSNSVRASGLTPQGERMLQTAVQGSDTARIICLPTSQMENPYNYFCQRWMDALSPVQTPNGVRGLWWTMPGADAIKAAWDQGLLESDFHYVDAKWVMTGVGSQPPAQLPGRIRRPSASTSGPTPVE